MPGNKKFLSLLFIAWIPISLQAQQAPLSLQDVEDLLYSNESALIPESLTGEYPESLSLTIDLNNASSEELEASGIFTPYQIHTLQTYREKFGPIYSIYSSGQRMIKLAPPEGESATLTSPPCQWVMR